MNDSAAGDNRARTALFNPFHMTKPAGHSDPQASDIRGVRGQGFRALSQDRQGEMCVAAAWRVSLWGCRQPSCRYRPTWAVGSSQ